MALRNPALVFRNDPIAALEAENRMLREEIRVSREAAEISAQLVVEQFEKTEAILAKLHQAHEEQTAILESSTFGIAYIKDRVTLKTNRRLEELLGYSPGELLGKPTRIWYPDDESYVAVGKGYTNLARGETYRHVLKMRHKNGSLFWCRLNGCALSSDLSRGSVWTVEDITAEHEANEATQRAREAAEEAERKLRDSYRELEEANERLQQLDKMKSDFLSSVSHELRTPLTSIRGFASLVDREFSRSFAPLAVADPGLAKKSLRIEGNLEIILKESERLTRLINDVLDLAKIEAGRVEWNDAPIKPEAFIRDAANTTHGMFEQKPDVELRIDVQDDLPPFVGDADRMLQVLVNLINNAIKFTDRGAVTVKAFLNPESRIQIEVRDTGMGFLSEDAEAIFDKFQQSKHGDTLADRPKGTGLGLSICKEIVERHGGQIWARSEPGMGSVFTFTLPTAADGAPRTGEIAQPAEASGQARTDIPGERPAPQGEGEKPKVLVVDDDPGVRDYLTQLLQEQGCEVVSAENGQVAIATAKRYQPDLITMDLAMPVMDGRTAIVNLRTDTELQHIPIMVISALPGWETAGGDLAMAKPLDETRFIENTRLLLGGGEGALLRKSNVLVLHDPGDAPDMAPTGFAALCEIEFCAFDKLDARIQAGFQGMVVIPTPLLGRVDLEMLNAAPSLEVMIMPMRAEEKKEGKPRCAKK